MTDLLFGFLFFCILPLFFCIFFCKKEIKSRKAKIVFFYIKCLAWIFFVFFVRSETILLAGLCRLFPHHFIYIEPASRTKFNEIWSRILFPSYAPRHSQIHSTLLYFFSLLYLLRFFAASAFFLRLGKNVNEFYFLYGHSTLHIYFLPILMNSQAIPKMSRGYVKKY